MPTRVYTYVTFVLLLLLTACTKEDLSDCPPSTTSGLWLTYYYTMTPASDDRIGADIQQMTLYLFDQDQRFYQQVEVSDPSGLQPGNSIWVPLAPGDYTVVSWGGNLENA